LLHNVDAIILRRFDFVLDSGRLMGVSVRPQPVFAARSPKQPSAMAEIASPAG
jgi:hypothetical protein